MSTAKQRNKGRARVLYVPFLPTRTHEAPGLSINQCEGYEKPVFVLPATPSAIEEMRERVAKVLMARECPGVKWTTQKTPMTDIYRADADAALDVLGLTPAAHKGRKS